MLLERRAFPEALCISDSHSQEMLFGCQGKEVAELRAEHRYVDACKISKGLEPKFGNFVTKAAVVPEIVPEPIQQVIETKPSKKENKKEKKQENAAWSSFWI